MLVHHPHNLGSVHCRTAAQRDDTVRCKGGHCFCTLLCAAQARVRCNIIEAGVLNSHLIQLFLDWFDISVLVQEGVGDDEAFLLAHHMTQFIQGDRHTALLQIYLLWSAEPQHILSPLGNRLDVQQMFDPYVFRNRVSTPGAASQCQRRCQFKVVQISNSAVGGRSVD